MTTRILVEGLSKSFATPVLNGINMEVKAGSIHGLVGENGAGKSTLSNIISGLLKPDAGIVKLGGDRFAPADRRESLSKGIALASQELSLVDTLSVAENILLSALPQKAIQIDQKKARARAASLRDLVGLNDVALSTQVAKLSLAQKQLVEFAKALSMPKEQTQLLILDEPTSALTDPQSNRLHQIIKDRAEEGLSVIYISHRLDEVLEVCDIVSILRDGEIRLTAPSNSLDSSELIKVMSGMELLCHSKEAPRNFGSLRLQVEQFSSADLPNPVSLQCHVGEVVGIAGLSGAGRSELLHGIFGLGTERQGQVILYESNRQIEIDSANTAVKNGMAMIAEDRKSQGIFATKSISLNTTVAGLSKLGGSLSAIAPKREFQVSEELIDRLKVACEGPLQLIERLSGGNQQKVLIARWLETEARIWLLDEPTRGVDVGSKLAIHNHLRELRDQGAAMIIASSELEELTALCDRILVLSNKKVVAIFNRGQWSKQLLLEAAFSEHQAQKLTS